MSQSTLIALAVVLLFVLYVAARGRLPQYMQAFGLASGSGDKYAADAAGGTTVAAGGGGVEATLASFTNPIRQAGDAFASFEKLASGFSGFGGSGGYGLDYGGGGDIVAT